MFLLFLQILQNNRIMLSDYWKYTLIIFLLLIFPQEDLSALTGRYRIMWVDDPATTMTIGWEQVSGNDPTVYFDKFNHKKS